MKSDSSVLRKIAGIREINLIIIIVVFSLILTILNKNYINPRNLLSIVSTAAPDAIIGIGMTILLISGYFDLAVGSMAGWGAAITGLMLVKVGMPVPVAIIIGLAACLALGYGTGITIAKLGVNPLITTIAMLGIIRGLIYVFTNGLGVPVLPDQFNVLGKTRVFNNMVQIPVIIMAVFIIVFDILIRNLRFFRQYFYIGGSEESAVLSGINVTKLKILGYILSALFSGFSGILIAARFGGAYAALGTGIELRVITGCVIGGCSLAGGEGSILGSFLGIIFMGIIANALNLLGVDVYWQQAILGSVLLIAILFDATRKKMQKKSS